MEQDHCFMFQISLNVETMHLVIPVSLLVQPIKLMEIKLVTGPGWPVLDFMTARETGNTNVVPL